ncbi:DUF1667 domain-containing protein [Parolsenella catena]|uniref:DUF1667 domain-containing protein n=1 Tax=Parolsenella catena TaxID=2003188 RepID=UPI003078763E
MCHSEKLTLTCVCCPVGCELEVERTSVAQATYLSGAACATGKRSRPAEANSPQRVVTPTVIVTGVAPPLPVKTAGPVPRELVGDVTAAAKRAAEQMSASVRRGDVVVRDVCGTGVDVVATADTR